MKQIKAVGMSLWLVMLGALPVAGQSPEPKALVITATNLTADSAKAAGDEREDAAMARPGDRLGYTLAFTNLTNAPLKQVQFVDPLPPGLLYHTGSARADKPVRIEFSIDGGKTYTANPVIEVMENGRKVIKPAPREAYSHIRWTMHGSLAPGAQVSAVFEAEVRQSASEAK